MKRTLVLLGLVSLLLAAPAASQDKSEYRQEEQIPSEEQAPVEPWTPPPAEPPPQAFEPPADEYPPPDDMAGQGPYGQVDWEGFVADIEAQTHGLKLDAKELRLRADEIAENPQLRIDVDPEALQAVLQPPERKAVAPPLPVNVERFGRSIHDWLSPRVNGYAFRLTQDGQTIYTGQWGWARRPEDGGVAWTPSVPMHIASMSKVITAIAMLHAMDRHGVSLDTPIHPYLPAHWPRGPGIDRVTFRQLFNHLSGFDVPTTSTDEEDDRTEMALIRDQIARGALARPRYTNVEFGICRILLAVMNGNIRRDATFLFEDLGWDLATSLAYEQYVQQHVFGPAAVVGATLDGGRPEQALAYAIPPSAAVWRTPDLWHRAGGVGWRLSVDQVLAVMDALRRGALIERPERIWEQQLGVRGVEDTAGGVIYWKSGAYGGEAAEHSVMLFLPDNMNLVVFINSPVNQEGVLLHSAVRNLYRNSFG